MPFQLTIHSQVLADGRFDVQLAPVSANMARLTGWLADQDLALQDLQTGGPSLEEIYLRLTTTAGASGSGPMPVERAPR